MDMTSPDDISLQPTEFAAPLWPLDIHY